VNANFQYAGANSYEFASYEDKWEWHWNATLGLTWSLWDGGLTRATVGEKELVLEKAREMLFDAIRGVELEVTQAFLDLQYARKRVDADEDNVELASRALRISSERYEAGLGTYLEFTDANVALSRARLNYLSAVHQHMNAVARLQHASGILHPAVAERMEQ
jgi:outer membrane protein TolC